MNKQFHVGGRSKAGLACRVCTGKDVRVHANKGGAVYYVCTGCNTLMQHPLPTETSMEAYADAEYQQGVYREYVSARDMKKAHFRHRLAEFSERFPPRVTLLDLGCACGFFIEVALEAGYDAWGLEFSQHAIDAADLSVRPRIMRGSVNVSDGPEAGPYDLVTAFDIIEHVQDPIGFLREQWALLRPGGGIVLSTPDAGHFLRYITGSHWPHLQPMQHTTLLSRQSLRLALALAGFEGIAVLPTRKVLCADYLAEQVRIHNPRLYQLYSAGKRFVPDRVRKGMFAINIGEMLGVAVKPIPGAGEQSQA